MPIASQHQDNLGAQAIVERERDPYIGNLPYPVPDSLSESDKPRLKSFLKNLWPVDNWGSRIVRNCLIRASGLSRFYESLDQSTLNRLLRTIHVRPTPCALQMSATVAIVDDPRSSDPISRCVTLLVGSKNLYKAIISGELLSVDAKNERHEMGQYFNLFCTSVVFEKNRWRLFRTSCETRIAVCVQNQIYIVECGAEYWSPEILARALSRIVVDAKKNAEEKSGPGIVTCIHDEHEWNTIVSRGFNRNLWGELCHRFITICLELDEFPLDDCAAAKLSHTGRYSNRWYQSSLQLVVFGNGKACAICSFSAYLDGDTMARSCSEIYSRALECSLPKTEVSESAVLIPYKKLDWNLPPETLLRYDKKIQGVLDQQQAIFDIPGLGTDQLTTNDLRAVPIFVMALQMVLLELTGNEARICQFIAQSRKRYLGCDVVNVSTPQTLSVVRLVLEKNPDLALIRIGIREAIKSQTEVYRNGRKYLSPQSLLLLFLASRSNFAIRRFTWAMNLLDRILPSHRQIPDVVISHPHLYESVGLIGRPGVRSNLNYFAMHYQIWPNRIRITIMPGRWTVPNSLLVERLGLCLKKIYAMAKEDAPLKVFERGFETSPKKI